MRDDLAVLIERSYQLFNIFPRNDLNVFTALISIATIYQPPRTRIVAGKLTPVMYSLEKVGGESLTGLYLNWKEAVVSFNHVIECIMAFYKLIIQLSICKTRQPGLICLRPTGSRFCSFLAGMLVKKVPYGFSGVDILSCSSANVLEAADLDHSWPGMAPAIYDIDDDVARSVGFAFNCGAIFGICVWHLCDAGAIGAAVVIGPKLYCFWDRHQASHAGQWTIDAAQAAQAQSLSELAQSLGPPVSPGQKRVFRTEEKYDRHTTAAGHNSWGRCHHR